MKILIALLLGQALTQMELPASKPHFVTTQGAVVVLKMTPEACSGSVIVLGEPYRCRPDNTIIVGIRADEDIGASFILNERLQDIGTLGVGQTAFPVTHPKVIPSKPAPAGRLEADTALKDAAYTAHRDPRWQGYHLQVPLWAVISEGYRVSSPYGEQRFWGVSKAADPHNGSDLAPLRAGAWSVNGPSVWSMAAGVVVLATELWSEGNAVIVYHGDGVYSSYSHLSYINVKTGEQIGSGMRLGMVGGTGHASGPHLHLALRIRDVYVDPLEGQATLNHALYLDAR